MPSAKNLTPGQTAAQLGVSPSTLRRWSTDYAEHLSRAANPQPGRRRSYTVGDLAALRRVGELLHAGKAPGDVAALLGVVSGPGEVTGGELVALPQLAGQLAGCHAGAVAIGGSGAQHRT